MQNHKMFYCVVSMAIPRALQHKRNTKTRDPGPPFQPGSHMGGTGAVGCCRGERLPGTWGTRSSANTACTLRTTCGTVCTSRPCIGPLYGAHILSITNHFCIPSSPRFHLSRRLFIKNYSSSGLLWLRLIYLSIMLAHISLWICCMVFVNSATAQ